MKKPRILCAAFLVKGVIGGANMPEIEDIKFILNRLLI